MPPYCVCVSRSRLSTVNTRSSCANGAWPLAVCDSGLPARPGRAADTKRPSAGGAVPRVQGVVPRKLYCASENAGALSGCPFLQNLTARSSQIQRNGQLLTSGERSDFLPIGLWAGLFAHQTVKHNIANRRHRHTISSRNWGRGIRRKELSRVA